MAPGIVSRITEIINQMMGEGQFTFLKETLPADPLGPFTKTLVFVGIIGIDLDHFLDVGQRGASLGMNATTTLENFGALIRLDTFPPAMMTMPSPSVSASGMDGHMV